MEENIDIEQRLSDETFVELRNYIYDNSGLFFGESRKYLLEGRIAKRMRFLEIDTFEQYVRALKSVDNREELSFLFEAVTINETFFFRNEHQFDAFENVVVSEISKNKTDDKILRVWSAASSSGEEAYTIAMIFIEKIKPKYPDLQIQIIGSDINNSALEVARKGVYQEFSMRNIPNNYKKKYFLQQGNYYYISDEVKRMVRFINLNLYDEVQVRNIRNCDIVFCCNVMIYFDLPAKQAVLNYIYNALNSGGYLFIGYSESLHGVSKLFKLNHLPKALGYKKE